MSEELYKIEKKERAETEGLLNHYHWRVLYAMCIGRNWRFLQLK